MASPFLPSTPGCNATLMTAILGQRDNEGGVLRESGGTEAPRYPNRFPEQGHPPRWDFYFCETEIKSFLLLFLKFLNVDLFIYLA